MVTPLQSQSGVSAPRLPSLLGVRSVCNVSVMFCHWGMYGYMSLMHNFYDEDMYGLEKQPGQVILLQGGFLGANMLLAISAFLAAYRLVPLLQSSTSLADQAMAVLRYCLNRLARIVPATWAALGLTVLYTTRYAADDSTDPITGQPWNGLEHKAVYMKALSGACPSSWHYDLMMAVPYSFPYCCMSHCWTLNTQMYFWLLFPWLLVALRPKRTGFHGRVAAAMVMAIITSTAVRVTVHLRATVSLLPIPIFSQPWDFEGGSRSAAYIGQLYTPSHTQLTPLASGVLLALALLRRQRCIATSSRTTPLTAAAPPVQKPTNPTEAANQQNEQKHDPHTAQNAQKDTPKVASWWVTPAAFAVVLHSVLVVYPCDSLQAPVYSTARSILTDLFAPWGPVTSTCAAHLLYCLLCSRDVVFSAAAGVLSSGWWWWPSRLSYCAYLVHQIVLAGVFSVVIPPGAKLSYSQPGTLVRYTLLFYAAVYLTAAVMHFVVEMPAERGFRSLIKRCTRRRAAVQKKVQ